jgi:hypothetical protein
MPLSPEDTVLPQPVSNLLSDPVAECGACQAASGCADLACFQVRVDAAVGRQTVRCRANACAAHIGELVREVNAWARDGNLTGGSLTVLVIDPVAEARRDAGGAPGPLGPGFPFTTLPIPHVSER